MGPRARLREACSSASKCPSPGVGGGGEASGRLWEDWVGAGAVEQSAMPASGQPTGEAGALRALGPVPVVRAGAHKGPFHSLVGR